MTQLTMDFGSPTPEQVSSSEGPRFTTEQLEVIGSFGVGQAVVAGAGAGKTTTLVEKCLELLRRNPDARFVAVSFTERSASDLKEKLSRHLPSLKGHWVTTIHGLCATILREHPRLAGFDGEERVLDETDSRLLWERALSSLWMGSIPLEVEQALERLLARETRAAVSGLIRRAVSLESQGALGFLSEATDPASQDLARVTALVNDRYRRAKRRRGAVDFGDLESAADQALESEAVRAGYHKRFNLVMVDEFQDTNPVQARILWRFARPDLSNLCVVGDPKQSIYRFRDADVSVFEELCAKLPLRQSLTRNFRSRAPILDWVNRVCAPVFAASQMDYQALIPEREAAPEPAVVRVRCTEPRELATWLKSEMARGLKLEDTALLLRRIRGNEHWVRGLAASGIAVAVGSGGLFWEDPRTREIVALLRAWDHSGNRLAMATFLRAPWIGIADDVLDDWLGPGAARDGNLWDLFLGSGHVAAERLRPLRSRSVRPGEILAALLEERAFEAEIGAPALGLWHRCEELSARGLSFHEVVRELGRAIDEGRRERDVPPPRNQGVLSVLTLHSSKGLEFPHVLLVDLEGPFRTEPAPLLFWDRERGIYLGNRDEEGERTKSDPIEKDWRAHENTKILAESKRLFYVALTRAKERVVLVMPPSEPEEIDPSAGDPSTRNDWRGWVLRGPSVPEVMVPQPTAGPQSPGSAVRTFYTAPIARASSPRLRPRHSVTEWNLLRRCPLAYQWTYIHPRPVERQIWQERQRDLGTAVHAALALPHPDDCVRALRELGEFQALEKWVSGSHLMAPTDLELGRRAWAELAFEAPVEGEVLVGSMDRVLRTEAGFELIDFKVTRAHKENAAWFDTYQGQIDLYAWALGRLDPTARGKTRATLVEITTQGVREVVFPQDGLADFSRLEGFASSLARDSAAIVGGSRDAQARPGTQCDTCPFKEKGCPAHS